MLLELLISVNVTGDGACGADGGFFAGADELYVLPVGEGEGTGCWHKTVWFAVNSKNAKTGSCRKADLRLMSLGGTLRRK